MARAPRRKRLHDGEAACIRVLQLVYDLLCEVIGRLDIPGADRMDLWRLRLLAERHLISEGILT